MRDVLYVAITIGFFGLCAAYVRACARVVGPDTLDTERRTGAGAGVR